MFSLTSVIVELLLARVVGAQIFTNTSISGIGNSTVSPCTYFPSECTALSSLRSCESLHDAYGSSLNSYFFTGDKTSSVPYTVYTYSSVIWRGNYTGPLSTFCDGIPRGGKAPAITTTKFYTDYEYFPKYSGAVPTCTFDYNACALRISEFRDATRGPNVTDLRYPGCAVDGKECFNPAGADCRIDAGEVKLIYWPQSKDPSALCANSTAGILASITPSPTNPPFSTILGNYTLTSPTVYLSFRELWEAVPCFTNYKDVIVPITDRNDLSSVSFTHGAEGSTLSINWNDLNSPVPMSAYKGQQYCWAGWLGVRAPFDNCSTIYDDYLPYLALPTNPALYTHIDPHLGNCTRIYWRKYVFDPPLPLTSANLLQPSSSIPAQNTRPTVTAPESIVVPPTADPASPVPSQGSPTATVTSEEAAAQPTDDSPAGDPSTQSGSGLAPVISAIASSLALGGDATDQVTIIATNNDPTATPNDAPTDSPTDPSATTQGGGGLAPIISAIASSLALGGATDPAAIPTGNNDPTDPAAPTNNDPASSTSSSRSEGLGSLIIDGLGGSSEPFPDPAAPNNNDPAPPPTEAPANNPASIYVVASLETGTTSPGAVIVVVGGGAGSPSPVTTTLLSGEMGVLGGDGVSIVVPSSGGAVVVGGTRTVGVMGSGTDPGAGQEGAVISGSGGGVVVTAVAGQGPDGGEGGGSVIVVGGMVITTGGSAVSLEGVGVVSAVGGGEGGGGGGVVVNGGLTVRLSQLASVTGGDRGVVITVGRDVETVSAGAGGVFVVGGTTLTVGGAAVTVSGGQVVSAASGGVVVEGTTASFESVSGSRSSGMGPSGTASSTRRSLSTGSDANGTETTATANAASSAMALIPRHGTVHVALLLVLLSVGL